MLFIGVDCDGYRALNSDGVTIHGIVSRTSTVTYQCKDLADQTTPLRSVKAVGILSAFLIAAPPKPVEALSCLPPVHPKGLTPYVIAVQFLAS